MKTLLIEPKKDHHSAASIQPFQRISYPLVLDVADGIDREAVPTEAVLRRTERNLDILIFRKVKCCKISSKVPGWSLEGTMTTAVRSSPFEPSSDHLLQPERIALWRHDYRQFSVPQL